jgi:hypothetical protein
MLLLKTLTKSYLWREKVQTNNNQTNRLEEDYQDDEVDEEQEEEEDISKDVEKKLRQVEKYKRIEDALIDHLQYEVDAEAEEVEEEEVTKKKKRSRRRGGYFQLEPTVPTTITTKERHESITSLSVKEEMSIAGMFLNPLPLLLTSSPLRSFSHMFLSIILSLYLYISISLSPFSHFPFFSCRAGSGCLCSVESASFQQCTERRQSDSLLSNFSRFHGWSLRLSFR